MIEQTSAKDESKSKTLKIIIVMFDCDPSVINILTETNNENNEIFLVKL